MLRPFPPHLAAPLLLLLLGGACNGGASDGPRGAACSSDLDCETPHCVARFDDEPEDLAPLALVCGDLSGAEDQGRDCDEAADCSHGACLLAGACATPC